MGIDIGTTAVKSLLFDAGGAVLAQSSAAYPLIHAGGRIGQDAGLWWRLACRTAAECAAACPGGAARVAGLSVSAQGISFVPVGKDGRPLADAVSWLDAGAAAETARLAQDPGVEALFRRTGKRLCPCYTLPKLMELMRTQPELYERTWKFLMALDFITLKLTGRAVTDHTMASGTMAYRLDTPGWDEGLLRQCGVDAHKLPEVAAAGSPAGLLRADAARRMGLPEGVPVAVGAQDQKCAALGAGAGPGVATVSLGTATAICSMCDSPPLDIGMRVPAFCLDESHWMLESVIASSGASIQWLRRTFFPRRSFDELNARAARSPAGAGGVCFYPHMEGASSPYWLERARGALSGLSLASGSGDVARAVLEGIGYQIAFNLHVQEEILGRGFREIRLYGGGARNTLWRQIIADIAGKPVVVPHTTEAAALGVAMLAGLGGRPDGSAWSRAPVAGSDCTVEPDPLRHRNYHHSMDCYLEQQDRLLPEARQPWQGGLA